MPINNISNIISINHYKINLENKEREAQQCMRNECGHSEEDQCTRKIATEGWHECVEEKRLLTVQEYMCMAPSVAEEFVKLWLRDNSGVCSRIMADNLRAKAAALKATDPLGILTMFAFIIGNPADDALRAEFFHFLHDDDDAGPAVTEANFYWEMEKTMKTFAEIKQAEWAWDQRITAHAGPNCDQCGEAREGIGGRVCERCDLEEQERKGDWGDLGPRVSRDIPRRTHDDGFDDYDGDDEEWETESQEAERRQEMAEEYERQMEAEEELNRAIFEMGSEATSDPHIRVVHNVSPVATGTPTCAGCTCDCGDNMSKGCCGHVCPPCRIRGAWVEV
jgi:hypothetical protein